MILTLQTVRIEHRVVEIRNVWILARDITSSSFEPSSSPQSPGTIFKQCVSAI